MQIARTFVKAGTDPFSLFEFETYDCVLKHAGTGKVLLNMPTCLMPKHWSMNARDTCISKYFRKAGVPVETVAIGGPEDAPNWLLPSVPAPDTTFGPETSIRDVVHRIVGHWTYTGFHSGYFSPSEAQVAGLAGHIKVGASISDNAIAQVTEENARAFYDEMVYMFLDQQGAPNSPQWFNTGLWWAYGIEGKAQGHYFVQRPADTHEFKPSLGQAFPVEAHQDLLAKDVRESQTAFKRVQAHACFILGVNDSMTGENGILDWYTREALIFKFGSGSGANISKLRAAGEPLSGGGQSSGAMSWAEVADRSAGAIKSGGTTRRAAKMVCMDLDHPDVLSFINCKIESESAVAAMVAGSATINRFCQGIMDCEHSDHEAAQEVQGEMCADAVKAGVPESNIRKAIKLAEQGEKTWPGTLFDADFNHRAYQIAPFQNTNHSVRIPLGFYQAVDEKAGWVLHNRTNRVGTTGMTIAADFLERQIAKATWFCGDPGVQYDDIINAWNPTPNDGRIEASNPCSEHMHLNETACNLASLRLTRFMREGKFDLHGFMGAVRLWTIALDITNCMAHLPDKGTAVGTYLYRDIGLGFADLGALLMSMGIPYDSDGGRAVAASLAAALTGQAYATSAEMAKSLGAYPRFWANRTEHLHVARMHAKAAGVTVGQIVSPCPIVEIDNAALSVVLGSELGVWAEAIDSAWKAAIRAGEEHGFRNAELTVIAPTGTIGIVMDCDTTGVEPMFSLLTHKQLVGGGSMTQMPASSVLAALRTLHASEGGITTFLDEVAKTGDLPAKSGMMVKEVFQTAMGSVNNPAISWQGHVKMMAAVQAFVSGGISKTINMPAGATIEDIRLAYRMGHDLGCKSLAIYRDGCKLSQPLTTTKKAKAIQPVIQAVVQAVPMSGKIMADVQKLVQLVSPQQIAARVRLGWMRNPGIDVAVQLGQGKVYLRTTRYDDGKCAEIWVTYSADQGIIQALLSTLCKTSNLALQHGVPLRAIMESWTDANFEPNGFVGDHPYIKTCKSAVNLVARLLLFHELGDTSLLNLKPDADLSPADNQAVVAAIDDAPAAFQGVQLSAESCPECGSHRYVTSGAGCKKCLKCGHSGSCG